MGVVRLLRFRLGWWMADAGLRLLPEDKKKGAWKVVKAWRS